MAKAIDQNKFYKIPPDNRDLNYENILKKEKLKFQIFKNIPLTIQRYLTLMK